MSVLCEVCIESVEGAIAADRGGANRLELCSELALGGLSPTVGLLREVRSATRLPIMAMVRPRGGNFCYSQSEIGVMVREIDHLSNEGVRGIVVGALTVDGNVDVNACRRFVAAAKPMSVTFHRAFDWTRDARESLETLISLGIDRVLTSGQQATAERGSQLLKALCVQAANRMIVMPGSGVSERNAGQLIRDVGAREIHFSGSVPVEPDESFMRPDVPMMAVSGYNRTRTCEQRIRNICAAVRRDAAAESTEDE